VGLAARRPIAAPTPAQVDRAIRLTYAQMMLNAVFGASTGGMFLVGFALTLGADDRLLGLMSTVPQYFVLFQFLAAAMIQRGISRKWMTVAFSFVTPAAWFLIGLVPLVGAKLETVQKLGILVGVMALVTLSGQFVGNARSSWIGELVPSDRRGRFFGYCTLFAGIVGSIFAVIEGRFLDAISRHGLLAFTGLFYFGALFGLGAAALNVPQPDCPLPGGGEQRPFGRILRETVANRPFVLLALVHAVIALGGIAGPFVSAYCLRDVGLSYFGLGMLNAVSIAAMLLASPLWGRIVDRTGCRPVLIVGLLLMAPCAWIWYFVPPGRPSLAYMLLPWTNLVAGVGAAAMSVAISTMIYKLSKPEGRSVQFAAYSVFVALIGAPMPAVGGWLVSRLQASGHAVDLRITFYAASAFIFLAALAARFLKEPESMPTRALVFSYFPDRVARAWGALTASSPLAALLMRFDLAARNREERPPDAP